MKPAPKPANAQGGYITNRQGQEKIPGFRYASNAQSESSMKNPRLTL
jgi:hypothetical protein